MNKWTLLICMFTCSIFMSCSDENANDSASIAVTAFTPTEGLVGTEVTITGTGFTKETSVWFNETKVTDIVSVESTSLVVRVPDGTTTGRIGVINGETSAFSTGNFTFIPGAAVTGYTPSSALPGEVIVIAGTDFHEIGAENITVVFTDGITAQPTAATATSITVVVPHKAVTGPVSVIFGDMETITGPSFEVLIPTIESYTSAMAAVGDEIGLNVMNFPDVEIDDIKASFTGANGTVIPATVKAFEAGVITVEVPEGATTGVITITLDGFDPIVGGEFMVTPTITEYFPNSARVGESILIKGTNFPTSGDVTVLFKTVTGSADENVSVTGTFTMDGLSVEIPVGAVTGVVSLVIGENTVMGGVFTVIESFTYSFLCKDVAKNDGNYMISVGVNPCDNAKEDGTGTVLGQWKNDYRGEDATAKGMIVWDTKPNDYIIFKVDIPQQGEYKVSFDEKYPYDGASVNIEVNSDLSVLNNSDVLNVANSIAVEKTGTNWNAPYVSYETSESYSLNAGINYIRVLYLQEGRNDAPVLRRIKIFN